MACSLLRSGADAAGQDFIAPGGHLPRYTKMKQVFARPSSWHISCRVPSHVWHGRNMGSQAIAMAEMEAKESPENRYRRWQAHETKLLIAAVKNRHDLWKLESMETAGIQPKKFRNDWKEIETILEQRGVQRSAEKCRSKWQRLMLTYLQIKCWEQNKTIQLSTEVLPSSLDEFTYNTLDELYKSRADAVKDGFIDDAAEDVSESGDLEHMLPGPGMQSPLQEKSVAGGTTDSFFPSPSQEQSYESHGTSSEFSCAEASVFNQKLVESAVNSTAPLDAAERASRNSSSLGLVVSHEMQIEKLDGAAGSVLQDPRHGQVDGIAAPVEETQKAPRESVASTRGNVIDEQQDAATTASIPYKSGSTDMNGPLKFNLEDSTNANVVPVIEEGAHAKQRGGLADSAACVEETDKSTQFSSTEMEICFEKRNEQIEELAASADTTGRSSKVSVVKESQCEDDKESPNKIVASIGVEIFNTTQSEQIAGIKVSESTSVAVDTTVAVSESTSVAATKGRGLEDSHSLPFKECEGIVTVVEGDTRHSSKAVIGQQLWGPSDEGFHNQETNSMGVEVSRIMQSKEVGGSEVSEGEVSSGVPREVPVGTRGGVQERKLEDSHSLPSHDYQGMDMPLEENTRHSFIGQSLSHNAVGSHRQETEYQGAGAQDKNTFIDDECGFSQPMYAWTDKFSSTVKEDEGRIKEVTAEKRISGAQSGEVCEEKGAKAFERPPTDCLDTAEKGNAKDKALQLYNRSKYDDDVFMYVPAAICNVIKSVSQTLKNLFKG